jgi:serine/threonine protein kinase
MIGLSRLSPSGHGEQWSSAVTIVPRLLAQRYQKGPRLGQGVYGTVYKAIDRREGRPVALKVVEDQDGVANPVVTREISMLRLLNGHPFIIE